MRLPRFVLALALLGTPIATVAVTATSASADPFTYTAISVATRGACALTQDGIVVCWGDNPDRWVFPDKPVGMVRTPTKISLPGGLKWKSINSGEAYANCGIAENDRAYCWGNHHIGTYFSPTSRTPVEVEFPANIRVTDVQSGYSTACATTTTSELWCWGDAHYLGDGSIDPVRIPVRIPMPDNNPIKRFNMGGGGVCAVTTAHNMYCWGNNNEGQLGLGYSQQFPYSYSWTPVLVPAPAGEQWDQPSYAGGRLCALTVSGAGYCSGDNYNGSFGNGTYNDSMRFTKMVVPDGERLVTLATGWYHTCVGTESGKMWCFGRGDYGELGTGTSLGGLTWRTPFVPAGVRFVSFDAGVAGTCALDTTGRIWCWGGMNWTPQTPTQPSAGYFPELIPPVGSPSVIATGSTAVDAEVATITGQVNPNGYASTVVAEVSTSPSFATLSRHNITASFPNDVYIPTTFSLRLTSLAPRTTHYVRLVATNTFGAVTGAATSFTTLGEEPTVNTVTASELTGNEASLTVSLNANRLASTAYLQVSTEQSFATNVSNYSVEPFSGNTVVERVHALSNLAPNTTYYIRGIATNRLGTTTGSTSQFTTVGSRPSATVTSTSATISSITVAADLNSGLVRGEAYAEASTSPSFTTVIRSSSQSFTSRGPSATTFVIDGLNFRTDYWVRVVTTNAVGSHTTTAQQQRTRGGVPTIRITSIEAGLRAAEAHLIVDSTGLQTFVKVQVSENADMSDATEYFVSSSSSQSETYAHATFQNLAPRTTYYATASATNQLGTARTSTIRFTTQTPIGIAINNDAEETTSATVDIFINPPTAAVAYRISNNSNFRNAKVFEPASPIKWELLASDEPEVERTVYVQVYFANGQVMVFEDSITLITDVEVPDDDAPIIEALRSTRVAASATASTSTSRSTSALSITVRDRRSGVTRIEMKAGSRTIVAKVDAARRGTYSLNVPKGVKTVRVRLRDAAGNYSKWKRITLR